MWNGINDKFDWLTGKIKSFANNVTNKLKGFFGIKSPSRVMRDLIGKNLILGIATGIDLNKDEVINSMKALKNDIMQPLNFDVKGIKANLSNGLTGTNGNVTNNNSNTTYTFNQYNTSPKPLNRLEIYRQTKNQLNFAKGV